MKKTYPFELPALPYAYDALEPYVDKETNMLHHGKHFQAYVNNLNAAIEKYPELHQKDLVELLQNLDALPTEIRTAVRNNGGGVYNHDFYFGIMTPNALGKPVGKLAKAIDEQFGSFEAFKENFHKAALSQFGSGWAWLVADKDGKLQIVTTPNQDVPLNLTVTPIIAIDVWEHAYYLRYQNRRGDYVLNWFNVVNWEKAEEQYQKAMK